jgi:hypothetical protein
VAFHDGLPVPTCEAAGVDAAAPNPPNAGVPAVPKADVEEGVALKGLLPGLAAPKDEGAGDWVPNADDPNPVAGVEARNAGVAAPKEVVVPAAALKVLCEAAAPKAFVFEEVPKALFAVEEPNALGVAGAPKAEVVEFAPNAFVVAGVLTKVPKVAGLAVEAAAPNIPPPPPKRFELVLEAGPNGLEAGVAAADPKADVEPPNPPKPT